MISKGNHVKFARFVWLAVGEEAKQRPGVQVNVYCRDIFFFVQCKLIIKQLLDSVCDDSEGLVKSYQLKPKTSRFAWLAKQRPGLQVNVYCSDISLFVQCIIKQLLDSVFVISRIIKVSVPRP